MFKFFQSESKSIIGAATIIGVFSFVSRLIGFIRDRILAGTFGAGDTLDVYYAAFKIPDFMFGLIVVGALSASFIPLFTKHYHSLRRDEAWKFTNNILTITMCVMGGLCMLGAVFSVQAAQLIAPGFDADKQLAVASFMRIMLVAQVILSLSTVFGSVLQSMKRFFLYALAPIFYNIGIIVGVVWFVDVLGPIGLAWGVVFGAFLHMLVQIVGCVSLGFVYKPFVDFASNDARMLIKLTGPRILGIAVNQVLFLFLTIIATSMVSGSVTILQFAYNIQFFPVGIFGVSLAVAAFPTFAEHLGSGDTKRFTESFSVIVRQALFFLIPTTLLFLMLRSQIVRVVVGAGAFDWSSTILTANTLAFFALTFIPQSLIYILSRAFFAVHDTVTPLTAGCIGSFVGIISVFLFKDTFGVVGLAMGYSLFALVNFILLWIPLRQRVGSLDEARIYKSLLILVVAGIVCVLLTQMVKPVLSHLVSLDTFFGVFLQGSVSGLLGLSGYLAVAWMLKSPELSMFTGSLQRKFLRKIAPHESVPVQE